MSEKTKKTNYQLAIETHYNAVLGIFRHFITQFADESVEIAARAVALAAPLPNAINMYNVAVRDLGYGPFASFAFALTLEIVVFLLVEIALKMWDGYLVNPGRFRYPFNVSIGIVLVATGVVIGIVYVLEPHKIMALLPVVSLCSFVGIGLKRWDERNQAQDEKTAKAKTQLNAITDATTAQPLPIAPELKTQSNAITDAIETQPLAIAPKLQTQLDDMNTRIVDAIRNGHVTQTAIAKATGIASSTLKRRNGDKMQGRLPQLCAMGVIHNSSGADGSEYRLNN